MVNKKVVFIIALLTVIIVISILGIKIKQINEVKYTFNDAENNSENTNLLIEENALSGDKNVISENVENIIEEDNTLKVEETDTDVMENTNTSSINTNNTKKENIDGKEKAIELAKSKWGEKDGSVYYYLEKKSSDNVYIISVRSKETTAALIDYEVNIETGIVTEY